MDAEGDQSAQERYARALLMDPRVDRATADALMRAMQQTVKHMREVQPPVVAAVAELPVGFRYRLYGGAVVDTIASSIGPLPAPVRDTWFASVILASFAAGVAYSRKERGPVGPHDIEAAMAGICDRFPRCTRMRVEAAARAAHEMALNWHQFLTME